MLLLNVDNHLFMVFLCLLHGFIPSFVEFLVFCNMSLLHFVSLLLLVIHQDFPLLAEVLIFQLSDSVLCHLSLYIQSIREIRYPSRYFQSSYQHICLLIRIVFYVLLKLHYKEKDQLNDRWVVWMYIRFWMFSSSWPSDLEGLSFCFCI
jgi:hypothetical protein